MSVTDLVVDGKKLLENKELIQDIKGTNEDLTAIVTANIRKFT